MVEAIGLLTVETEKNETVAEADIHKDAVFESQDSQLIPGNQEERNMNNKRLISKDIENRKAKAKLDEDSQQ